VCHDRFSLPDMPQQSRLSGRFFYGWVIVAVCGLTLLIAFGIRLSFTVFFVALLADNNWDRAETALVFSASMIVFTLASTPAGAALDRWGVRRVFSVGAFLLALGLFLSSRIQTLPQLTLTYGVLVGLGITILGLGPQASVVARWFKRYRGLAIGITFAGTGLGTLLLTPGSEILINAIGWRGAYMALAVLALALIPPIILFLRLDPSSMGLHPDGERLSALLSSDVSSPGRSGWTMSQVVRTPSFWLVIVAGLCAIGPLRMLTVHQLAAMVDAGVDRLFAATMIGIAGAVTAVAFVMWGTLSDRFGRRQIYLMGSICSLAAIAILGNLNTAAPRWWLVAYSLLLGLGEGSRASLITAVASDLFPGSSLGAVNGAVGSAFGAGAAVFPWLAGRMFDQSGSYTAALYIGSAAILVSLIALWLAPAAMPSTPAAKTR
jgi:MFS family permease